MPSFLSPSAYGAHAGGELHLPMHPRAALERVRAACDELHSWQGGGIAFGKKPYLGEVKRNTFRVRTLSFRRDGAVGFLVGAVEPSEGGTKVTYRIESPLGFVHSLPVAALAPAALLGIGGYLAAPVFAPAGAVGQIAFIAACATAGLVFAAVVIALLMRLIRSDTQRLLRFVETTFSTTDP